MTASAPHLEVNEECLWRDVCLECFWVREFLHPCILDDGEDKLRNLVQRCLIGTVVRTLGLVRRFFARADDGCGIVIDRRVAGLANSAP